MSFSIASDSTFQHVPMHLQGYYQGQSACHMAGPLARQWECDGDDVKRFSEQKWKVLNRHGKNLTRWQFGQKYRSSPISREYIAPKPTATETAGKALRQLEKINDSFYDNTSTIHRLADGVWNVFETVGDLLVEAPPQYSPEMQHYHDGSTSVAESGRRLGQNRRRNPFSIRARGKPERKRDFNKRKASILSLARRTQMASRPIYEDEPVADDFQQSLPSALSARMSAILNGRPRYPPRAYPPEGTSGTYLYNETDFPIQTENSEDDSADIYSESKVDSALQKILDRVKNRRNKLFQSRGIPGENSEVQEGKKGIRTKPFLNSAGESLKILEDKFDQLIESRRRTNPSKSETSSSKRVSFSLDTITPKHKTRPHDHIQNKLIRGFSSSNNSDSSVSSISMSSKLLEHSNMDRMATPRAQLKTHSPGSNIPWTERPPTQHTRPLMPHQREGLATPRGSIPASLQNRNQISESRDVEPVQAREAAPETRSPMGRSRGITERSVRTKKPPLSSYNDPFHITKPVQVQPKSTRPHYQDFSPEISKTQASHGIVTKKSYETPRAVAARNRGGSSFNDSFSTTSFAQRSNMLEGRPLE